MSLISQFTRDVKINEGETEAEFKADSVEVFSRIVQRTPVDTGRARNNWDIDIPGGFSSVFITNDVPYIDALENGSSRQAPAGMVRISLDEVFGGG